MSHANHTFEELFCVRHQIGPERYSRAVFWRCLYWHAYLLAPLLVLMRRDYFTSDFDLIERARRVRAGHEIFEEIDDYQAHPWNRGFTHRFLRVRLSGKRIAALVCETMATGRHIVR